VKNQEELVKIINERTEKSRVLLRQNRDKVKEAILQAEKDKELAEDDRYRFLRDLDEFTTKKVEEINEIAQNKEKQIMNLERIFLRKF
jgi:ribosome recycling factor